MSNFHIAISRAEEIIPRLGKQQAHWKAGRSAYELSNAWIDAGGIPASVSQVFAQVPEWRSAKLIEGIFERETAIPGRGLPSQTDLLAIVALPSGNAIVGVEGKVDETFGPLVGDWLAVAKDDNRRARLDGLCDILTVDRGSCDRLFYQLFHRTCAAVLEAKRFGYERAVMLVHSFATPSKGMPAWFEAFSQFAGHVGMPVEKPGTMSPAKLCAGIETRLAWVSDRIRP